MRWIKRRLRQLRRFRAAAASWGDFATLRRASMPAAPRGEPVAVRLRAFPEPFHVRPGTSDAEVLDDVLLTGQYAAALPRLSEARVILDLGSNVGISLRLWRRHAPGARLVGVEPDAGNVVLADLNNAGDDRVKIVQAGAAATAGSGHVSTDRAEWSLRVERTEGKPEGNGVALRTVPQLLAEAGVSAESPIDLLKCDIEGAEAELFGAPDAGEWLGRVRLLIVEVHTPYRLDDLRRDVMRHGLALEELASRQGRRNGLVVARVSEG